MSLAASTASATCVRPHRLRRELAIVLACKLAALILIYALFFSSPHRHAADIVAHVTGGAVLR